MNLKPHLVAVSLFAGLGCTTTFHLYPVLGPRSAQRPLPVLMAQMRGSGIRGTISFTLPDGEACTGPWSRVEPGQAAPAFGSPVETAGTDLSSEWDGVYGPGYYVANVLGAQIRSEATVKGDRGSFFRLEFYRNTVEYSPTLGVAKDNQGNVYKVAL